MLVEPLGLVACEALLDDLGADLDPALPNEGPASADGNPLFVEEMAAMVRDSPGADVQVPPTISALLSARLDQLAAPERAALACGSVEGSVFHRTPSQALEGDPGQLMALVRKELVRPDKGTLPGDDAFRFRHILIRDAAYEALPKATRARLHERFADWLEQRTPELVELDEIVGYHLEQATQYRLELGALGESEREVAARGAERLLVAGERALVRRDVRASASLLGRGLALLPAGTRAVEREWKLVLALMECGELATALERADDLAARAPGGRRPPRRALWAAGSSFVAFLTAPEEMPMDALAWLATSARSEFEATGDELGVGLCWFALAHVHHNACRWQERHEALELAHLHGVQAHDAYLQEHSLLWMAAGPVHGPMPTDEGLLWFAAHEPQLARRADGRDDASFGRGDDRELRRGQKADPRCRYAAGGARTGALARRDRDAFAGDRGARRKPRGRGAGRDHDLRGAGVAGRARLALDGGGSDRTGASRARPPRRGRPLDRRCATPAAARAT